LFIELSEYRDNYMTAKTPNAAEKLAAHLKTKWKDKACPLCSVAKWSLPPMVFELRSFHSGSKSTNKDPILPLIPITCENCGTVQLVNAIIAGIVPPSPKKQSAIATK
jgi:hypothetical protein